MVFHFHYHLRLSLKLARKLKSFKHRKSLDGIFCDNQTTSALRNKIDEPFTSANLPDLETASDKSSEQFSLLYPKLSSNFYSTSSVDDILNYEPLHFTSTSRSQPVTHSYNLRSRPIQTSSSSSTRLALSSISALFCQHVQPH